jgi:hypothetical protein
MLIVQQKEAKTQPDLIYTGIKFYWLIVLLYNWAFWINKFFQFYSAYDYEIQPSGKVLALTDIQIAVPQGCYGRVAPRSGLAHKNFIDVGAGVIDRDYRGNVGVILFNFGKEVFKGWIFNFLF